MTEEDMDAMIEANLLAAMEFLEGITDTIHDLDMIVEPHYQPIVQNAKDLLRATEIIIRSSIGTGADLLRSQPELIEKIENDLNQVIETLPE